MSVPFAQLPSTARRVAGRAYRRDAVAAGFFPMLMALTLVRGVIYAVLNPPFGSPDEGDHFQFVAHLATAGAAGERGREGHQPELYYALMVPAYLVTAGHSSVVQLLAIRLSSIVFLLGMAWLAWEVGRLIAPDRPALAIGTASIVALSPENSVIAASASNDAAANFMAALLTLLSARLILRSDRSTALAILPAIGVAVMTKGTIVAMVAISLLALAIFLIRSVRSISRPLIAALSLLALLVFTLPLQTEGGRQAIARASGVLAAAQGWEESLAQVVAGGRWPWLYQFKTFWATFLGDTAQPAAGWYLVLAALVVLAVLGHMANVKRLLAAGALRFGQREMLFTLFVLAIFLQWLTSFLVLLLIEPNRIGYVWYRSEWSVQGRYQLPTLIPFSILLVEGLRKLSPKHADRWIATAVPSLMLAFDANALLSLATFYVWPPDYGW